MVVFLYWNKIKMQELEEKPSELLQAQVATFAAEHVEHYQDRAYLFNNLGNLAVGPIEDVIRTTTSAEFHKDENGNNVRIPEGTKKLVASGKEYLDFMHSVGGSNYEAVQGRSDILRAYSAFAPTIDKLRGELADATTRKEHPAYLGNGSNSTVFEIDMEGQKYAVRVPNGNAINPAVIDDHLAGAVLGKGLLHLEQIVAASYEDGVTVAEKMPGKEVGHLTTSEIEDITDGQLGELVSTLVAVHERGIEIDPKPSNFFYDPEAGYGIVDYHSSEVVGKNSKNQELGDVVGWAATMINNTGFYGKGYKSEKAPKDYALDLKFHVANLDVLNRYRTVVEQKLTGEEQEKALKVIDAKVQTAQETVINYSDPTWVAERVAQNNEWARQRAVQDSKTKAGLGNRIIIEKDFV